MSVLNRYSRKKPTLQRGPSMLSRPSTVTMAAAPASPGFDQLGAAPARPQFDTSGVGANTPRLQAQADSELVRTRGLADMARFNNQQMRIPLLGGPAPSVPLATRMMGKPAETPESLQGRLSSFGTAYPTPRAQEPAGYSPLQRFSDPNTQARADFMHGVGKPEDYGPEQGFGGEALGQASATRFGMYSGGLPRHEKNEVFRGPDKAQQSRIAEFRAARRAGPEAVQAVLKQRAGLIPGGGALATAGSAPAVPTTLRGRLESQAKANEQIGKTIEDRPELGDQGLGFAPDTSRVDIDTTLLNRTDLEEADYESVQEYLKLRAQADPSFARPGSIIDTIIKSPKGRIKEFVLKSRGAVAKAGADINSIPGGAF